MVVVPADAVILEPDLFHRLRRQAVAPVENESGRSHAAGDVFPVCVDYLFPLGEQDEGLRSCRGLYRIVNYMGVGRELAASCPACAGIEGADFHSLVNQRVNQIEGGGVAHVVGFGLERESEDADLSPDIALPNLARRAYRGNRRCLLFTLMTERSNSKFTPLVSAR